jgi:hypothetical protein
MAFPHPQPGNDHSSKEDVPSWESIVWKLFKRTVNITEYRNGKDDVNPANNRTLDLCFHGQVSFSMPALLQSRDYSFQGTDKLLPAGAIGEALAEL